MIKGDHFKKLILIEFAIWLIIALSIVIIVRHFRISNIKSQVTHQIFMPDVDGLIVGSPVKFMGVEIGHINNIKIVGSEVYVKFLITRKDIDLPKGVIATTEFSGLGGSKSLELYPPTKDSLATNKIIEVQSPTRLRDVFVLLYNMVDKINAIAYKTSNFSKKAEGIYPKTSGTIQFGEMQSNLNVINIWIETLTDKVQVNDYTKH